MASNTQILQDLSEERRAALGPQFGTGSPIGGNSAPVVNEVPINVPDVVIVDDLTGPSVSEAPLVEPVVPAEPVVDSTKGETAPTRRTTTSGTKASQVKT